MRNLTEERADLEAQVFNNSETPKIPDSLFKFTEYCLFSYHENLKLMEEKRKELESFVVISDSLANLAEKILVGPVDGGKIPVPAAQRLLEMELVNEDILMYRRRTEPITGMIATLGGIVEANSRIITIHYQEQCNSDYLDILKHFYFSKPKPKYGDLHSILSWSEGTIRNRRKRLVALTCKWIFGSMVRIYF